MQKLRHLNTSKLQFPYKKDVVANSNCEKLKYCIIWGSVNVLLVAIISFHIWNTIPNYIPAILYAECVLLLIFLLNLLCYIKRYVSVIDETGKIESKRNELSSLRERESDLSFPSYNVVKHTHFSKSLPASSTPIDRSARRCTSTNINSSLEFNRSSPNSSASKLFCNSSESNLIRDEHSLNHYLKGYETYTVAPQANFSNEQSSNLLTTFWSDSSSKALEGSPVLNKCSYHLSSLPPTNLSNQSDSKLISSPDNCISDPWKKYDINNETLTQWNSNIRKWLSQTILDCLSKEIDEIDSSLLKHGVSDVQMGYVGLDRLRQTAQSNMILQLIPNLSILVPFLEVTTNQEYLVNRIRQLARGGCMSDFKWKGGGRYNDKEWNTTLPSDSQILMHFFITYMDTQLLPVPNHPEIKPFSGHYYIKLNEEVPPGVKFAIQLCCENPPHFRVHAGGKVYEITQGYNNLFHTILFFLHRVNEIEYGMLGGINLGKSGVNILWVIDC